MNTPSWRRWWLLALPAVVVFACTQSRCAGPGTRCERAIDARQLADAATLCEAAWQKTREPKYALLTLRALLGSRQYGELAPRIGRLDGTPLAPAQPYYRGMVALIGGDTGQAEALFAEGVALAADAGMREYVGRSAQSLASVHWSNGRFAQAFDAIAIALAEQDQVDIATAGYIDGVVGDLMGEIGQLDDQAQALERVSQRFKTEFPSGFAQTRVRQARVELDRDNPLYARSLYREALSLSLDAGVQHAARASHLGLAEIHLRLGELDAGERELREAAAIPAMFPYEDTALAYHQAQLLEARGELSRAQDLVHAALDAGAVSDWTWRLQTLDGRVAERLDAGAEVAYRAATVQLEKIASDNSTASFKPGVVAERREPWEALFALRVQHGDSAGALGALEHLLSPTFLETMTDADAGSADLKAAVERGQQRLELIDAFVERTVASAVDGGAPPLPRRGLITYVVARGTLYRGQVLQSGMRFEPLGAMAELEPRLEALHARPDDQPLADELGARLWPSASVPTEVVIVADTALARLSFAGLRKNGRYLVEDHVISYVPSLASALVMSVRTRSAPPQAWFVGDPTSNLPNARAEATALAAKLDGTLVVGDDATRARWKAGCGAGLMHFAGHSGLSAGGPWLQLADGQLAAAEVLREKCAPRVMYLASCVSAVARQGSPSSSLAGAFLAAGSRYVVATNRAVDDAHTRALSTGYFESPLTDPPPLALARAQRKLLKTLPPSAWASFVVLGP